MSSVRQPIITVLGHVDHGKTSLLDYIRGTTLAAREAGKITQHIGATEVPLETINKMCGTLLKKFGLKFLLPGLLFVDTPGHEAFTNLRKRGGSIADLAVLIVDINEGLQPQTKEAIQILKTFKVPFIVAVNKIDLIPGWKPITGCELFSLQEQPEQTRNIFDERFYKVIGQISELGFDSNIFTEVNDYSKTIAVVPISAKTGEGVPELLSLLAGLSQRFLLKKLEVKKESKAKGTILEINEKKGLGTTADVIVYEGTLRKNDIIVVGGMDDIFNTKIRALLKPKTLSEIRDKKSIFRQVDEAVAASGVKICAPDLERAIAGSPFIAAESEDEIKEAEEKICNELQNVCIETEQAGVILKADTLGSLEAISTLFKERGIPIKHANIGNVAKRDILEAKSSGEKDEKIAFVIAFNVDCPSSLKKEAKKDKVNIILSNVIYKLVDEYEEKKQEIEKRKELESLKGLVWPFKIKILPQYIFRQSNPAVFGVEVITGKVKPKLPLMSEDGKSVGQIQTIEDQGEKKEDLSRNEQAAISVSGMIIGRHAVGGDILYSDLSEDQFRLLKDHAKKFLSSAEVQILKEIAQIKRQDNEIWGL